MPKNFRCWTVASLSRVLDINFDAAPPSTPSNTPMRMVTIRLNIDKCKTVSYYLKYPPLDTQYHIVVGNTTYILEKLNSVNDLGVIFDSNL